MRGIATTITPCKAAGADIDLRVPDDFGWPTAPKLWDGPLSSPYQNKPMRPLMHCARLSAALAAMCAAAVAWASPPPEMIFTRLGSHDGLAQGAVMAITQDAQGFMWFGTEDGLDRFDGYELKHFISKRGSAGSLPNNWVSTLARDASGDLWVGSDGGGLARYNPDDDQFLESSGGLGPTELAPNARVRTTHVDHLGRLWAGTRDSGVIVLDITRHESKRYRHDPTNLESLSSDSVYTFAEEPSGQMWIGTGSGLDRIDPHTGQIESFGTRLQLALASKTTPLSINVLYFDQSGVLWVGLDSGLATLDPTSGRFTFHQHRDGDISSLPAARVTAFLEDDERRLWVGTSDGLTLLDRRNRQFTVFRHVPSNPDSLPDNNIVSLFQDRAGLLWIGTKSGGLARWNPRSWSFGHHRFGTDGADNVTAFATDRRGTLWVGSFGAGVASIDSRTGAVIRYRRHPSSALALHDDQVMALTTDDRGRIWIGTMNSGIDVLDPTRREMRHIVWLPNDTTSLPAPGVMCLLRDARGRIWVGTFGGGLARIDPDSGLVTRYPHGRDTPFALLGDRATAIAEDHTGLIWVGTDTGGLNVLDPTTGRFVHYIHDPKDASSLSANTVYSIHVDDKGLVWVGTRGGGLDRAIGAPFAPGGLNFENLSESEGLPNSNVYGIESGSAGDLWLSTNRGVAAVRTSTRHVSGYRDSHGLQGDEFNFGAHYKAPDGTLYFGGSNGYNAFQPELLKFNNNPPPVVLTNLMVLNRELPVSPDRVQTVNLDFREPALTVRFSALDFTGPRENQYAYRLDGFDTQWVNAGTNRQATYTNLAGGDYIFNVRAANSDGHWSEPRVALRVHVTPPPWATWWARTIYGLGLFAVVLLVWLWQYQRMRREVEYSRRLKQEVDDRTAELAARNIDMESANRQLHEASITDLLTHLGNRRLLQDKMAALFAENAHPIAQKRALGSVVMIVDLDMLKPINDKYGHAGGDAVLRQVADILRGVFRSADVVVRWGGDEFVVLCLDIDLTVASELAERVRAAVAKRIFRVGEGLAARTSCSIGLATLPFIPGSQDKVDWEQSLSLADLALYEAKRERNTWVAWSGTQKTAELSSLLLEANSKASELERDGFLTVRRRQPNYSDTVDQLRVPRGP